jgi:tetratricopeptide (TPR) repeat protein
MLDAQWGGTVPFFYHLDNILLHLLAAALVFYFLAYLTRRRILAGWLSLLFLVHPVLTQAVAWLPGRNDSLLAIFVLAAFLAFWRFAERPKLSSYLAYLGFFIAALLTKENAIVIPVLVIFYFLFIDSRNLLRSDKYLLILGSGAAAFVWFLARHLALGGEPTNYLTASWGILANWPAVVLDIGKLVFPINLSVLPILADSTLVYGIIAAIILAAALFWSRQKRYNYLIFGGLWFFLFLLPSFIRLNALPDFLEHRLYVPLIGFLIIIGEIDWIKNYDFSRWKKQILAVAIILIFAVITCNHSALFSDRLTFWRAAVNSSPHSPLAQRNLGVMYYFQNDFAAALKYDQQAIALNSQEPMVHNNLGVIYLAQKKYSLAEQAFKAELAVNPGYDKALFNLGDLYYRQKNWLLAAQYFSDALQVNPDYYEAYQRWLILQNKLR